MIILVVWVSQGGILGTTRCFCCVGLVLLWHLRWSRAAAQINGWCLLYSTPLLGNNWHWIHWVIHVKRLHSATVSRHLLLESNLSSVTCGHIPGYRALPWSAHYIFGTQVSIPKFVLNICQLILRRIWETSNNSSITSWVYGELLADVETILDHWTSVRLLHVVDNGAWSICCVCSSRSPSQRFVGVRVIVASLPNVL